MADFKTYNVVYNITATDGGAGKILQNLATSAEKLGNGNHMRRFNSQIKELANYSQRMTEAMNSFSPRVDMRTFKAQLQLMERAVGISAQNMRGMIQMALNGTNEQFERAMKGKGSWASVLREGLLKEEKEVKKQLTNTTKEIDRISKLIANANNGTRGVVSGRSAANLLTDKEKDLYKKQLSVLKAQEKSLTNSIGSITDKLNVLGRTAPTTIKTSVNAVGNVAENAEILNKMTKAISKYNKVTANMPKSQTYKIKFNAQDNTGGAIKKIREQIALLKAEAATIFMGGAPSNATKRTSNKRPKGVLSSVELKNQESLLNTLKQLSAAKANGIWSREMTAIAGQVLPAVAQALGMPVETPMNNLLREYNKKYNEEVKKYQDWRNSNAKPKTTAAPKRASAPVRTTVPLGIQSPSMWAGRIYQIPTIQMPQMGPATVGLQLDRSGLVARGQSGLRIMQEAANRRPVSVRTGLDRTGLAARGYQTIQTLQAAADQRPIRIKGTFDQSGLRFSFGRALVELQNIANARPINIRGNFVGGAMPTSGAGAARTYSTPKPGVYPSGNGGSTPPPSMPGVVPSGTRRNPVNVRNIYDGGVFNATKRWLYPLTGNTSFGARTPAVVEMAKGMGMMMAVGGAMGAVGNSFSQSVDYQNMMTTTRAILGRNYRGSDFEGDISAMEKIVRREGVLTKFTAPEVAGAAKYLAMAGMDIPTINAAIKPVTNIALAGDIDLPTAADKMTNIMTAFQMKTPKDFIRASDVLTNTFTKSNTNILQLAEAAQYAAPIAAARGMKLEDMMALVGVMSDAGIQSSMAGTSLRMMMNNIYKPSKEQLKTWNKLSKLGVSRTDKNGNWLSVIEILDQISQKVPVNGKSGESLADIMGNLFRVTSAAGATQLAKNITKVKALRDSNYNSYGAAESIRDARINNVRGKWAQVSSQFTENMLKIFEKPESQQKIMDMLDRFRSILAKPETVKALESVFDVMLSMADFMGKMAEIGMKLVGSAPNLMKAMLQFQFAATMLGSYIITPIVQLVNTIGTIIPGLGRSGGVKEADATALNGGAALASGLTGASLAGNTSRKGIAATILRNNTIKWNTSSSASRLAAGRSALLGGVLAAAQARQIRYESLANRLNYKAAFSNNPHDEYMAALRADRHAKEQAEIVAGIRNRMAPVTRADALSRYQRIYGHNYKGGFWGRAGVSLSRGFYAGQAYMMASTPIVDSISRGFRNMLNKLAFAFGALLTPLGMATVALGGLAGAAISLKNRRQRQWDRWQDEEKASIANQKNLQYAQNIAAKKNPFIETFDLSAYQNKNILNTDNKFSDEWQVNPLIRNNRLYSEIFKRDLNSNLYSKTIYNSHIQPYSKLLFGQDLSYDDILKKYKVDGYVEDLSTGGIDYNATFKRRNEVFQNLAAQSIPIQAIFNSRKFKTSYDELLNLRKQFSGLSQKDRSGKVGSDLMSKMRGIRDRFINIDGIDTSGMSASAIGNMRSSSLTNTVIGNDTVYDLMTDLIANPDNPINKYEESIAKLQTLANDAVSQRAKALANIVGGFDFALKNANGELVNFNVFMQDNGKVNWEMTMANLDLLGVKVTNSIATNMNIISGIVFKLKNDAETAAMFADQSASQIAGMLGATPTKIATKQLETYAKQWAINTGYVKSKKELNAFIARRNWNTPQSAKAILDWVQDYTYNNTYGKISSNNNNSNIKSPNVYKPSIPSQDKYKNNYSSSAGAPSQIVINIDKLANFDKTTVANSADDREIAEAMERKIADAVAMLASQYMPMVGAQTLGNA